MIKEDQNEKKKKLYGLFLWMKFDCVRLAEPLLEDTVRCTSKSPEVSRTHLIDLGRMKG